MFSLCNPSYSSYSFSSAFWCNRIQRYLIFPSFQKVPMAYSTRYDRTSKEMSKIRRKIMTWQTTSAAKEEIRLRATHDFHPRQMSNREKMQLNFFLKNQGLMTKGEEIELNDTLQGGILMEYLSATKQISETYILRRAKEEEPELYEDEGDVLYYEDYDDICLGLNKPIDHFNDLSEYEMLPSKRVAVYSVVLTFKRGNIMETIPPANIGDAVGWWLVKNLESGEIGFIPRNRVVIEKDQETSKTTLNELPLELLDFVLENSFLQWILKSLPLQKHEDVIKTLAYVDFCWFQRAKRRRFKKRIWQRLKDFNGKTKRRSAIIRNNRNYLLENILPNDELIASLLSLNCITQEQSHIIEGQRSKRDKNDELLHIVRSFDETKFSYFVQCLRQINQKTVARIMDNGGVAIKVEVQHRGAERKAFTETQLLFHQALEDLRIRTTSWSHRTYELISRLKEEGLEILNSQLDRQTVVVWIWCHSQAALENIQKLFESNQLREIFFGFAIIEPSTSEFIRSVVISIDSNQLKRTVVVRPISISFTEKIDIPRECEVMCGVTKLRSEIYVLSGGYTGLNFVIRVFEDWSPFRLLEKIQVKEFSSMHDIGSSEKENCLYVADGGEHCVWKITKETDDQLKIIKWLTVDCNQCTLSVSSISHLLIVGKWSNVLSIYRSDAELLRSIQLPRGIKFAIHAVETSIGNFIILHEWMKKEEEGESGESAREWETKWVVSELTRDGQMVIRRFIPSNETQKLIYPAYLSLDSDDRVFVADSGKNRVILLDSDLTWNRILCPTKKEEGIEADFERVYYDEGKKQLICTGYSHQGLSVYTLNRE